MTANLAQAKPCPHATSEPIAGTPMEQVMSEESEQAKATAARFAELEKAAQEYWDARAENPFQDLGRLLFYGDCRPAQLATAIVKHGIQGWDRFGRFTTFSATSQEGLEVLDALAHARSLFLEKGTYRLDEIFEPPRILRRLLRLRMEPT